MIAEDAPVQQTLNPGDYVILEKLLDNFMKHKKKLIPSVFMS